MQTHTIMLKARVFSDEEEETIRKALAEFIRNNGDHAEGGQASNLLAELEDK